MTVKLAADDLTRQQVKARVLRWAEAKVGDESAPLYEHTDDGWVTGKLEIEDVPMGYRRYAVGDYDVDPETIEPLKKTLGKVDRRREVYKGRKLFVRRERMENDVSVNGQSLPMMRYEHDLDKVMEQLRRTIDGVDADDRPNAYGDYMYPGGKRSHKLGYGEVTAPEVVDTLREADCPVCGNDEFDGKQCQSCGFKKPPDQYMDPDLDKAKEVDLRGGEEDPMAVGDDIANAQVDDLVCDNCGETFSSAGGDEGNVKKVKAIPELPKPEDDEDTPETPGQAEGKVEGEAVGGGEPDQDLKAGDQCPACGKGKLTPNNATADTADTAEGVFIPPEGEEDVPPKPAKKAASQKGQNMKSALAALGEQQKVIEDQAQVIAGLGQHVAVLEHQMGTLARLAGVEKELITAGRHAVASLRKKADVDNPAQPVPAPASEAPEETTQQALAPAGMDDVTSIGASPVADVQPDAQTSVDAPQTVLDEPLDLNEENVTAPVAGTEGPLPLDDVKIETDVRVGNPDDPTPAFPLEGPFAQKATTGARSQSRAFASLRLARLRQASGISPEGGDDLTLGQEISESDMSDEVMAHEIDTLARIVQRTSATRGAPRNLVPKSASRGGQRPPSLRSEAAVEIPQQTMAPGVTADEMLFE